MSGKSLIEPSIESVMASVGRYLIAFSRKSKLASVFCCLTMATTTVNAQGTSSSGLSNATILVIRHAEKPPSGDGLTPQGQARATAYAKYFEPFNDGKESFNIDALYATSDTTKSARPKLTLTPLSQATKLPIDTRFGNYDVSFLVQSLRTEPHGKHVLISWHHGHIPELITTLGVDSRTVLPNGKWPDDVFDWVIEIKYDKNGKVLTAQRIQEQIR